VACTKQVISCRCCVCVEGTRASLRSAVLRPSQVIKMCIGCSRAARLKLHDEMHAQINAVEREVGDGYQLLQGLIRQALQTQRILDKDNVRLQQLIAGHPEIVIKNRWCDGPSFDL
jgi:hypothetical protein